MNSEYLSEKMFYVVLVGHRSSLDILKYNDRSTCFQAVNKERLSEFLSLAKVRFK